MDRPLTALERKVLDFLIDYLRTNTFQPSVREICERFGIRSTKSVTDILEGLARKGYVERAPARSRGVKILNIDLGADTVEVPQYGEVADGDAPLRPEAVVDRIAVGRDLLPSLDVFFLRVVGDSMRSEGIVDGDLVCVQPAEERVLESGVIVAARIEGRPVVKEYLRQDGRRTLRATDPPTEAVDVDAVDDFRLLGRVVGLFRRFSNEVP